MRRVVVTGMGAVTPIGIGVDTFWENVKKKTLGFGEITRFDTTDYKVHIAAEVKDFAGKDYMDFKAAKRMELFCLYAVAAREEARAKAFAETYGAEHYYGSYEEMLQDDGVELVYIATPHSHHAQHAKLCIEYGRPVLCEKAFTWTAEEAEEVLRLAKEKQVFITEAMWVRYMPMFRMLIPLDARMTERVEMEPTSSTISTVKE